MSEPARKVCLLGDVGVGKTSLVTRFAHGGFSPDYLTTVGVKVDTRRVVPPFGNPVKLVVWDIAGTDALSTIDRTYLRSAAGYMLVADGSRPSTLEVARGLHEQLRASAGELPFVALVNKRDLEQEWVVDDADLTPWYAAGFPVLTTSARSGENVEFAFQQLALQIQLARARCP
jgi:small GTP-binding protein